QVMRIERIQKGFSDLGELVVDLVVHAAAQQREGFDEPFDVRVFACIGSKQQAVRNLRIFFCKLAGHLTNKRQLALVIRKQFVSHWFAPETAKRRESRRRVASKTMSSPGAPAT